MEKKQLIFALTITWLVLSFAALVILALPYVLSDEAILRLAPACESKLKYNTECMLCGMTTSFLHISRANFNQAYQTNRGSILVYVLLLSNQVIVLGFLGLRAVKHTRHLDHTYRYHKVSITPKG